MAFRAKRGPYQCSIPARTAILDAVWLNPGASRSDLIRLTRLSWGSIAHHVQGLLDRGEIESQRIGKRDYYCRPGAGPSSVFLARLLRERSAIDLVRILNSDGPFAIQALSERLAADRKTVRRHLQRLAGIGMVGKALPGGPGRLDPGRTARLQLDRKTRFELRSVRLEFSASLRGHPGLRPLVSVTVDDATGWGASTAFTGRPGISSG